MPIKYDYFLTQDGKLYHSDVSQLTHWKYTRRERVNGKWKYYYDNDPIGIKRFIETKITNDAQKQHMDEEMEAWRKRIAEAEKALTDFEKKMTFRVDWGGSTDPNKRTYLIKGKKVSKDQYYRAISMNKSLYEREQSEYTRLWNATKELSPQAKNVRDGKSPRYYRDDKK